MMYIVPVYQLGVSNVTLPGSILMTAGLPSKSQHCYSYDSNAILSYMVYC